MPITTEQLRNYSFSALDVAANNTLGHISQAIASHLHSVHGLNADRLREVVTANAAACADSAVASICAASNSDEHFSQSLTIPRIRNNSAYAMDVDSVRNTLEGMTRHAVFGDLAVLRDRQLSPSIVNAVASFSRESLLRKLKEDCRREELEQIKILRSIKATIRYIVEIK